MNGDKFKILLISLLSVLCLTFLLFGFYQKAETDKQRDLFMQEKTQNIKIEREIILLQDSLKTERSKKLDNNGSL